MGGDEKGGPDAGFAESLRKAAPYIDAAWQLTGGVAVGVLLGYFADRWLGTKPWLLVAGSLVGMAAGFVSFFRVVLKLGEKEKR